MSVTIKALQEELRELKADYEELQHQYDDLNDAYGTLEFLSSDELDAERKKNRQLLTALITELKDLNLCTPELQDAIDHFLKYRWEQNHDSHVS